MKNDFSHVINGMNSELEFGKLDAIISNEIGHSSLMALMPPEVGFGNEGKPCHLLQPPKTFEADFAIAWIFRARVKKQATLRWLG
ncbi:hypothetical protein [Shewanella chilikensis]|uniref:Uncharacterized protein n=1 Tax=Shewanella chilikensis TaxID=558541 RepID=A0A6G7LRN4_9GAMM|nr:hypothetical protein [Shewanella chilikensis]QIJ04473.1 hypothetical protein GII14_10120 [Shewanella chilikensis]